MALSPHQFPSGLTVPQLKQLLATWPDTDANGDPCEVWVTTVDGLSSLVTEVCPLNKRLCGGHPSADLLLSPPAPET